MEESVLCAIAEHCGIAKEVRSSQTLAATVKLKKVLVKKLPHVIEALGWVVIHPIAVYEDGKYKVFQCIALADAWITGNHKPSAERIETLRTFFHIGEGDIKPVNDEPAWWIDMLVPHWHYRHKVGDLKDYRPWDLQPRMRK